MKNILLIGFGLYLLSKGILSKIKYFPVGVSVNSISLDQTSINLQILVQNESGLPIQARGFVGRLFFRNEYIGTVSLSDQVNIPSPGQGQVTLIANIETPQVIPLIVNANAGVKLRLSGRVYFENTSLPVNTHFEIL